MTRDTLKAFEEEVRDHYLGGKIRAPVHLSRGNEQQLIEIFKDVGPNDFVFSTYRSHYHALLKGIPRDRVMAEILAGHSIHLSFPDQHFYSSAIVAGCLPIALGTALGIKRRGGTERVWCFVGDMASLTGSFHECVQYAQGFDLPILFVTECNNLSTNTPTHEVWGVPHAHVTIGGTVTPAHMDGWNAGGLIRYCYDREWPHYGIGEWVNFDRPAGTPAEARNDVMS